MHYRPTEDELCEQCGRFKRIKFQRFCHPCKARLLHRFFETGYLDPGPVEQWYDIEGTLSSEEAPRKKEYSTNPKTRWNPIGASRPSNRV